MAGLIVVQRKNRSHKRGNTRQFESQDEAAAAIQTAWRQRSTSKERLGNKDTLRLLSREPIRETAVHEMSSSIGVKGSPQEATAAPSAGSSSAWREARNNQQLLVPASPTIERPLSVHSTASERRKRQIAWSEPSDVPSGSQKPKKDEVSPIISPLSADCASPASGRMQSMFSSMVAESSSSGPKEGSSWRARIYSVLEEPDSGTGAQCMSIFLLSVIVFAIACFIIETMPESTTPKSTWKGIEVFCTIIFTAEYLLRLGTCTMGGIRVWQFVKNPSNIVDVLAIIPFYIGIAMQSGSNTDTSALRVLRAVRLFRLFRIFKLGRYSKGMTCIMQAMNMSMQALWVLSFLLLLGVILFASALFYAERYSCPLIEEMSSDQIAIYHQECRDSAGSESPSFGLCCDEYGSALDFPSIVETSWWAIVTMTTVGFGDLYPRTIQGKIVSTCTMLSGILIIALPVAIVGRKFEEVMNQLPDSRMRNSIRDADKSVARLEKEPMPATPMTGMGDRLRQLRPDGNPFLDKTVGELSDLLDEAEFMAENMHCFEITERVRRQQIHKRFDKVLDAFIYTLAESRGGQI